MRAIDTNVLVRLLTGDHESQIRVAEEFVENGAWISTVALAETVWVLSAVYERDARQIAVAVRMLLTQEHLVLDQSDAVAAAVEVFERAPKKVGFTDCLVLELSKKAGHTPLGTFDRRLAKVSGTRLIR